MVQTTDFSLFYQTMNPQHNNKYHFLEIINKWTLHVFANLNIIQTFSWIYYTMVKILKLKQLNSIFFSRTLLQHIYMYMYHVSPYILEIFNSIVWKLLLNASLKYKVMHQTFIYQYSFAIHVRLVYHML